MKIAVVNEKAFSKRVNADETGNVSLGLPGFFSIFQRNIFPRCFCFGISNDNNAESKATRQVDFNQQLSAIVVPILSATFIALIQAKPKPIETLPRRLIEVN